MPELPEVETTLRGIEPHLLEQKISKVVVRETRLRWPVSEAFQTLKNAHVSNLHRRAKYIIMQVTAPRHGHIIIHLGMSGSLRVVDQHTPLKKHDHIDFILTRGKALRYHDPRRFGAVLWTDEAIEQHILLKSLGPEPLSNHFHGEHLFNASRKRKMAVKNFIMDAHVVVGVGNIYASEALFAAGIRPGKAAGRISKAGYEALAAAIKTVLARSIAQGGTTLRDFVNSDGQPGYFQQTLNVYGRQGEPCRQCSGVIKAKTIGQRSTFYCSNCQS
ncbi:MAG: bifunctional DNA-formamidopyrimidine glycosylase/DNA-(apurinic or apyrimidinic site) lyase [Pseudomonadota bacterium]